MLGAEKDGISVIIIDKASTLFRNRVTDESFIVRAGIWIKIVNSVDFMSPLNTDLHQTGGLNDLK